MIRKVYFAKSQQADSEVVQWVYGQLRAAQKDFEIEIVEHSGPSARYDPKIARHSDYMILVPPETTDNDTTSVFVGKGIYSTLEDYLNTPPEEADLNHRRKILVAVNNDDVMELYSVESVDKIGKEWKTHYAEFTLSDFPFVSLEAAWDLDRRGYTVIEDTDDKDSNIFIILARKLGLI